jgi:hypothetical protein
VSVEERLEEMLEVLRFLWPKGYGNFPFQLGEAPYRAFYESDEEQDFEFVYGIIYRNSILRWAEDVEEVSILPRGKRRRMNGWIIDRYRDLGRDSDGEPEFTWDDQEFHADPSNAAVAFATIAVTDRMFDALGRAGML